MRISKITAKSVLNKHKKRDEWFLDEYSVNPYYGCSLACVYCYTRGGKYGKTPAQLSAKINAPEVLDRQLRRRANKKEYGFIAIGTSTEPYMPVERELKLTRKVLEVIKYYRFPAHILTKSDLVLRDVDLLLDLSERAILPEDLEGRVSGSLVTISASTLDEGLSRMFEPGAPPPLKRIKTLEKLIEAGVQAGMAFIPVLPYISDSYKELRKAISTAKEYRAKYVFVGALTLPREVKRTFFKLISSKFPELLPKYRKLFKTEFPKRSYQDRLYRDAQDICEKYGVKLGIT